MIETHLYRFALLFLLYIKLFVSYSEYSDRIEHDDLAFFSDIRLKGIFILLMILFKGKHDKLFISILSYYKIGNTPNEYMYD